MSKILLIETATAVCSVAIAFSGKVVAVEEMPECPKHTAILPLQIQQCLRAANISPSHLDAIAVSAGPGSYTMLRTGASLAKGMCYALHKPLIAVNTLQAIAWGAKTLWQPTAQNTTPLYMPMLDARRNEVWTALYDQDLKEITPQSPLILERNLFEKYIEPYQNADYLVICGNGMAKMPDVQKIKTTVLSAVISCSASWLAVLAETKWQLQEFEKIADFEPFYMKDPNITTPAKFS